MTIRELTSGDRNRAVEVINTAAEWYREFLPPEEIHSPEMDEAAWEAERRRMTWWGAFIDGELAGVIGSEPAGQAVLLRHAYILPRHQRRGVASALVEHIEERLQQQPDARRLVVGTYAANYKARGHLEKSGFRLAEDPETALRTYYDIPEGRLRASVVYEKPLSRPSGEGKPPAGR